MASYFGIISWVPMLLTKKTWKFSFHKLADKKDSLELTEDFVVARSYAKVQLLANRCCTNSRGCASRGDGAVRNSDWFDP